MIQLALVQPTQHQLDVGDDPASEAALREAFWQSGLSQQGYTFELAIRIPAIRTCLVNTNIARLRAKERRP